MSTKVVEQTTENTVSAVSTMGVPVLTDTNADKADVELMQKIAMQPAPPKNYSVVDNIYHYLTTNAAVLTTFTDDAPRTRKYDSIQTLPADCIACRVSCCR